jgi:hypothetical protein
MDCSVPLEKIFETVFERDHTFVKNSLVAVEDDFLLRHGTGGIPGAEVDMSLHDRGHTLQTQATEEIASSGSVIGLPSGNGLGDVVEEGRGNDKAPVHFFAAGPAEFVGKSSGKARHDAAVCPHSRRDGMFIEKAKAGTGRGRQRNSHIAGSFFS